MVYCICYTVHPVSPPDIPFTSETSDHILHGSIYDDHFVDHETLCSGVCFKQQHCLPKYISSIHRHIADMIHGHGKNSSSPKQWSVVPGPEVDDVMI